MARKPTARNCTPALLAYLSPGPLRQGRAKLLLSLPRRLSTLTGCSTADSARVRVAPLANRAAHAVCAQETGGATRSTRSWNRPRRTPSILSPETGVTPNSVVGNGWATQHPATAANTTFIRGGEIGCLKPDTRPAANSRKSWAAMVRKGSSVRVRLRLRASQQDPAASGLSADTRFDVRLVADGSARRAVDQLPHLG